jgi:uncharacterized protein
MNTVNRIDKARITGKIHKDADGTLRGSAVIARIGVLEYFEGGKIVRELVTPEELGRADSTNSLKMKPVTNNHPSVSSVTPQNVRQFQCGFTGETVGFDGELLSTTITVNDAAAIYDVEVKKKRELSAGYTCSLDETPGTWENPRTGKLERYDRKQVNRQYNHVAICDLGRAGPVASLHLDAADVYEVNGPELVDHEDNLHPQRSDTMKLTINGVTGEFTETQVAEHVAKQDKALADAAAAMSTATTAHKTALDSVTADRDNYKDKFDKLDSKVKTDAAALPAMIVAAAKARTDLERIAIPHMDAASVEKIGTLSDVDIKKVIVAKAFPKADLKDVSDVYLQARYDAALEMLADGTIDEAARQQRVDMSGKSGNGAGEEPISPEQQVADRYKKVSNRDSLMK